MAKKPVKLKQKNRDGRMEQIIKLAIMAVGGQGGSVLTNWIEECARIEGYAVQSTSVAGVAQRTGATIYYVEMVPASEGMPVFSLMPAAGDVDILIAAEMMEAGRAIMRGFVTPDRTTLIASSHRALAVSEKTVPGDGIASTQEVLAAAEIAAQRLMFFDMEKIAADCGTVISASLFGALAASGALPFSRDSFEAAIKASGRGVEASLKAFSSAFDVASGQENPVPEKTESKPGTKTPAGPENLVNKWQELVQHTSSLPLPAQEMAMAGLRSVVDYQDLDYGREYLDRVKKIAALDASAHDFELTCQAAKYFASAMTYDDVFRVADIKTRASRFARVRDEIKPAAETQMKITEFMHPRAEELIGLLPAALGKRLSASPTAMGFIDKIFNRGRHIRTDRLLPFLQLYVMGGLRRFRRGTWRHAVERQHLENWLETAISHVGSDYALAVEILRNRRLVKGYSHTHARSQTKYDRVMSGVLMLAGRNDAAQWTRRLREAALRDEKGDALDEALKTIRSFAVN